MANANSARAADFRFQPSPPPSSRASVGDLGRDSCGVEDGWRAHPIRMSTPSVGNRLDHGVKGMWPQCPLVHGRVYARSVFSVPLHTPSGAVSLSLLQDRNWVRPLEHGVSHPRRGLSLRIVGPEPEAS